MHGQVACGRDGDHTARSKCRCQHGRPGQREHGDGVLCGGHAAGELSLGLAADLDGAQVDAERRPGDPVTGDDEGSANRAGAADNDAAESQGEWDAERVASVRERLLSLAYPER